MYSRSLDYGPYQGVGYGSPSYGNDLTSFPSISPSFQNSQNYTYNFHNPAPVKQQSYRSPLTRQINNKTALAKSMENKSFLDGFDNNTSGLLNQQKSHARNIRGRFSNQDPNLEAAKQQKQMSYKEELQRQIEETRARKQAEKQKIEKEQIERQRKFYEQFKIQAQVKDNKTQAKQQNGYFMMRTLQKFKKPKNAINQKPKKDLEQTNTNPFLNPPAKGRGKTYQNKSSLDNWGESNVKTQPIYKQANAEKQMGYQNSPPRYQQRLSRIEEQIVKQRMNEQERLSKLLLFQQRVLQKISDIKSQIRNTVLDFDGDKELQRVRNNLRAKPIPFDEDFFKSDVRKNNIDANHFYSLPKREPKSQATRYSVKLRDAPKQTPLKSLKSEVSEYEINDKNKIGRHVEQNQQALE